MQVNLLNYYYRKNANFKLRLMTHLTEYIWENEKACDKKKIRLVQELNKYYTYGQEKLLLLRELKCRFRCIVHIWFLNTMKHHFCSQENDLQNGSSSKRKFTYHIWEHPSRSLLKAQSQFCWALWLSPWDNSVCTLTQISLIQTQGIVNKKT